MQYLFLPIETPNGFYIYDGNTHCIIKVDADTHKSLHGILMDQGGEEGRARLHALQAHGFCLESRIEEISHSILDDMPYYVDNQLRMLTLQVTKNCNLRCSYCIFSGGYYNREHGTEHMKFETAIRAIDYAIVHSKNAEEFGFSFYGGEPLLAFDLIRDCIRYIRTRYPDKNPCLTITTNGTLLYGERLDFLVEEGFDVMISLDGPKEMHDANRKYGDGRGSFEDIMQHLAEIKLKYPKFYSRLRINTVLSQNHDFSCVKEFYEIDDVLDEIALNVSFVNDNNKKEVQSYEESFLVSYDIERIKMLLSMIGLLDESLVSKLTFPYRAELIQLMEELQMQRPLVGVCHHSGPCIAGAQRTFVDVDGNFFPCERVSETSEIMCIGNLDEGIDIEKAAKLVNIGTYTQEECKGCWNIRSCMLCAATMDDMGQLSRTLKLKKCAQSKRNKQLQLKEVLLLREHGYDLS